MPCNCKGKMNRKRARKLARAITAVTGEEAVVFVRKVDGKKVYDVKQRGGQ